MDPRESVMRKRFEGMKKIVVVSSKGGVGKSTLSALLALMLSKRAKVGLLDLDAYNPSIPSILGMKKLEVGEDKGIKPQPFSGISVLSFAHFIGDRPMPLRGKDLSDAVKELFSVVVWDTDVLVVDTPPGMGEVTLEIMRLLGDPEFLVITTPSLLAEKALSREMALLGEAKVLGVVKNMSSGRGEMCIRYSESLEGAYGNIDKLINSEVAKDAEAVADVIWKRLTA